MVAARGVALVLVSVASLCGAATVHARDEEGAVAEAREHFERGMAYGAKGRWQAAEQAFRESLALASRPHTRFNLALALFQQKRPIAALRQLDKLSAELDAAQDSMARKRAEALRARAKAQVARLVWTVEPPDAEVHIEGVDVDAEGEQRRAYLRPGTYPVRVTAPGHEPKHVSVTADAGTRLERKVTLDPVAPASEATPEPTETNEASSPERHTARERSEPVSRAARAGEGAVAGAPTRRRGATAQSDDSVYPFAPWMLTISGGTLLTAAVVTGVLAWRADREVLDRCPEAAPCADSAARDAQARAQTFGVATDILWISGAVSLGSGLLWMLLSSSGSEQQDRVQLSASVLSEGGAYTEVGVAF